MKKLIGISQLACTVILALNSPVRAIVDGISVHSESPTDAKIIEERTVRLSEMDISGKFHFLCSGVLKDNATLITAGHCFGLDTFAALNDHRIFVEYRSPKMAWLRSQIEIPTVRYTPSVDIAIARLTQPAHLQSSLPVANDSCDKDGEYTLAGYGLTQKGLISRVKISRNKFVAETGDSLRRLQPIQGSACRGDSGGPVFCRTNGHLALAGVLSEAHMYPRKGAVMNVPNARTCQTDDYLTMTDIKTLGELPIIK